MAAHSTSLHLGGVRRIRPRMHARAARVLVLGTVLVGAGGTDTHASSAPLFDRENLELGSSSGYGTEAADLNQDGLSDLIVCGYTSTRFYPGNGDGTFNRLGGSRVEGECSSFAIGNLDDDPYPDVITGRPFGSPALQISEYDPASGLTVRDEVPVEDVVTGVEVGDFDGDTELDVIVATREINSIRSNRLTVFFNDGLGALTDSSSAEFRSLSSLSVGELTGDLASDITVGTPPGIVRVVPGAASRELVRSAERFETGGGLSLATGDIAGDSQDEIVAATAKEVLVLRRDSDGVLRRVETRPGGTYGRSQGAYTAYLNEDARADVVAVYRFGTYVYATRPDGQLAKEPVIHASGHVAPDGELSTMSGLSFADFNEDARTDMAGVENRLQLLQQISGKTLCRGEAVNAMGSDLVDQFDLRVPFAVVVRAGKRDDSLQGSDFDDLACGGPGAEYFVAGPGNDRMYGGPGDDGMSRGSGALNGGRGDDRLVGEAGDDRLGMSRYESEAGDDTLIGGIGNDILLADAGDDVLRGGPGRDVCDGGTGSDSFSGCERIVGR